MSKHNSSKNLDDEAEAWNNWRPGSGRKGYSPFNKPMPPVRDGNGFPLIRGGNGKIDWNLLAQEREEQRGKS